MSPQPSLRITGNHAAARIALTSLFLAAATAQAKAPKRCDWHGPLSGGESPFAKCVDFSALNGSTINLPKNVTRIAADGLSFCAPKNPVTGPSDADIVFIYDNSGSMTADALYAGSNKDTSFFYFDSRVNKCPDTPKLGQATYRTIEGTSWTVPSLGNEANCGNSIAGDPYMARGYVIKQGIDFLAKSASGSTAGVIAFSDSVLPNYGGAPKPVSDASAMAQLKAAIKLDTSGGTLYRPPLLRAKQWLSNPTYAKTKKQAIIFISDGAPNKEDYADLLTSGMPTIYSIYLAKDDATQSAVTHLQELADKTGGTYTRVNPKDPAGFLNVVKGIITTITTNPGMPKAATIANKTLQPPQTSHTAGVTANPDGSVGMRLDSIIALAPGKNSIEIQLTRDDNTTATYAFTMDVAGDSLFSTGGNFSCYDPPALTALDPATNLAPEVYGTEKGAYPLKLTRSPSDLGEVSVTGTSANGDKEAIKLGAATNAQVLPTQVGELSYDPAKGGGTPGNGVLEVDNHGDLTFTWSHPRDPREAVTYVLPGRIVPILSGKPEVQWITDLSKEGGGDHVILSRKPDTTVLVTDLQGRCLLNCVGTEEYHKSVKIPAMKVTIRSPIRYTARVFDNFGQFVNEQTGELGASVWSGLSKSGDSSVVVLKLLPFSKQGQALGTGAYVLKLDISALGDQVTKDAAGESIVVKNARREYVSRFGYLRAH